MVFAATPGPGTVDVTDPRNNESVADARWVDPDVFVDLRFPPGFGEVFDRLGVS
jgi:hypothetical protein